MPLPHLPVRLRPAAAAVVAAAVVTAMAAGCSSSSPSSSSASSATTSTGSSSSAATGGKLETTHLTVAAVRATDEVPFEIAEEDGFFAKQGLTVTPDWILTSGTAIPDLARGSIDMIGGANFVSFFEADANGALPIKVVAPAGSCTPQNFDVLTLPGSHISKPSDLVGKTISVPTTSSVNTLLISEQLRVNGVNPSSVHFVDVPFADMLQALQKHEVDAISLIEPFLTQAEVKAGATNIMELCSGPTANFPLSGYVSTPQWAAKNPNTAAAFARALAEGAQVATTNHAAAEHALSLIVPLTPASMYSLVNYNQYPLSLNPVALQQVTDLMFQGGMLKKPLSVKTLTVGSGS